MKCRRVPIAAAMLQLFLSLSCLAHTTAVAQTASVSSAPDTKGEELPEIVVNAEKRSEGLQHVPVAVSVVTAANLEVSATVGTQDLTQLILGARNRT